MIDCLVIIFFGATLTFSVAGLFRRYFGLCLNFGMFSGMALLRNNAELFPERRLIIDAALNSVAKSDHGSKIVRRGGRRFSRITKQRLLRWSFLLLALFSIFLTVYGLKKFLQGEARDTGLSS